MSHSLKSYTSNSQYPNSRAIRRTLYRVGVRSALRADMTAMVFLFPSIAPPPALPCPVYTSRYATLNKTLDDSTSSGGQTPPAAYILGRPALTHRSHSRALLLRLAQRPREDLIEPEDVEEDRQRRAYGRHCEREPCSSAPVDAVPEGEEERHGHHAKDEEAQAKEPIRDGEFEAATGVELDEQRAAVEEEVGALGEKEPRDEDTRAARVQAVRPDEHRQEVVGPHLQVHGRLHA